MAHQSGSASIRHDGAFRHCHRWSKLLDGITHPSMNENCEACLSYAVRMALDMMDMRAFAAALLWQYATRSIGDSMLHDCLYLFIKVFLRKDISFMYRLDKIPKFFIIEDITLISIEINTQIIML